MNYKSVAVKYAGKYAEKNLRTFESLKRPLEKSGLKILFKSYVAMMLFYPIVLFLASIPVFTIVAIILQLETLSFILTVTLGPLSVGLVSFLLFYITPGQKTNTRKRNIEANLPFAINHMAAIASSGVPPTIMFRLLSGFAEYEEVSIESSKIVRNTEVFGQDITTSMTQVADTTPSDKFRELLFGILSVIKTGGNLKSFLSQQAEKSLFTYRIAREEYLDTLSTYADFYTAVLIAAPLFLIAILAVMNIIGGSIGNLTIQQILGLSIWVIIPMVNVIFLTFIQVTQPEQS